MVCHQMALLPLVHRLLQVSFGSRPWTMRLPLVRFWNQDRGMREMQIPNLSLFFRFLAGIASKRVQ